MDAINYLKFVMALLFVLALIGLLALVLRRYGLGLPQTPFKRPEDKRLGLVEIMPIDAKRRLLLIRRDDVEHLIVLGATEVTVIEKNITPPPAPPADFPTALKKASLFSWPNGQNGQKGTPL